MHFARLLRAAGLRIGSDRVVDCVKARANSATFSAPQGGAAVVQVPVSFVKQ